MKRSRFLLAGAGFLLVLTIGSGLLLSVGKATEDAHRPGSYPEAFDYRSGTLADYLAFSQRHLRVAHGEGADPAVLDGLAPFRLEPAADCPASGSGKLLNGIVLTHELQDSAWMLRELGEHFQARCFLVIGLLLPGHGTRPGDLLTSDWQAWAEAEGFAARAIEQEADNVYLGGHGAGGTLALLEAARNPDINGLFLVAPVLNNISASWFYWLAMPAGWLFPAARWADVRPEDAPYHYQSRPYRLARETTALVRATRQALAVRQPDIPVFMVASMEDSTASTPAMLAFMAAQPHPASHTVLYSQADPGAIPGTSVYSSNYPETAILSFGHRGLIVPLYDPWYGWNGAWRDCGHYQLGQSDYTRCKAGERDYVAETTEENLQKGLVERIAFNPLFVDLLRDIDAFLAPLAPVPAIEVR
jgi:alpha-beta hydrolase superfamily lysophospholipase